MLLNKSLITLEPRRNGKSTELVKYCAQLYKEGKIVYIVCLNPHQIADLARELKVTIPFPLNYNDFKARRFVASSIYGFLLDNLDQGLYDMSCGLPILNLMIKGE